MDIGLEVEHGQKWNSSDTEAFIKVKKALLELSFSHTVEEEFLLLLL